MGGKRRRTAIIFLLLLTLLGPSLWKVNPYHASDGGPSPDSPTLAPDTALNMLYDANLSNFSLKPYYTYWVDGKTCRKLSPHCRILRMESIVEVGNRTYLAFFDFQNKTLDLVPTNETAVREYIKFFNEHGGRAFACNSTVKAVIRTSFGGNITVRELNGTCVVPAIVGTDEG